MWITDLLQLWGARTLCQRLYESNASIISVLYLFDHETEDCSTLIARLRDKGALQPPLTQNLQMMRYESCEEDPNMKIMLQSGITVGDDKGKQPKYST